MGVRRPLPDLEAGGAPQRDYALRDIFDALWWLVKTGTQRHYLPGDPPPWETVYQQARRWLTAASGDPKRNNQISQQPSRP